MRAHPEDGVLIMPSVIVRGRMPWNDKLQRTTTEASVKAKVGPRKHTRLAGRHPETASRTACDERLVLSLWSVFLAMALALILLALQLQYVGQLGGTAGEEMRRQVGVAVHGIATTLRRDAADAARRIIPPAW